MPRPRRTRAAASTVEQRPALKDKSNNIQASRVRKVSTKATDDKDNARAALHSRTSHLKEANNIQTADPRPTRHGVPKIISRPSTDRTNRHLTQKDGSKVADGRNALGRTIDSSTHVQSASSTTQADTMLEQDQIAVEPMSQAPELVPATPGPSQPVTRQNSRDPARFTGLSRATPAVQNSILALKHFKRRPRQPSMLAMVQQQLASTRSSLMNTVRPDESSIFDLDDIEDDLLPDAASTPLNTKVAAPHSAKEPSTSSQKRSFADYSQTDLQNQSTTESQARGRSRKIHAQEHDTRPQTRSGSRVAATTGPLLNHSAIPDDVSSPARLTGAALPSSNAASPVSEHASLNDVTAEPLTQPSPSPRRGARRRLAKPPSTADLRSLLPKRRRRTQVDAYADVSSSDTEGEDSVYMPSKAGDKPRAPGSTRASAPEVHKHQSQKQKGVTQASSSGPATTRKNSNQQMIAAAPDKTYRTYSRKAARVNADTEVSSDDPYTVSLPEVTSIAIPSAELDAARKKFEEIDQWSMEYEAVSFEDSRSSNHGWR